MSSHLTFDEHRELWRVYATHFGRVIDDIINHMRQHPNRATTYDERVLVRKRRLLPDVYEWHRVTALRFSDLMYQYEVRSDRTVLTRTRDTTCDFGDFGPARELKPELYGIFVETALERLYPPQYHSYFIRPATPSR